MIIRLNKLISAHLTVSYCYIILKYVLSIKELININCDLQEGRRVSPRLLTMTTVQEIIRADVNSSAQTIRDTMGVGS